VRTSPLWTSKDESSLDEEFCKDESSPDDRICKDMTVMEMEARRGTDQADNQFFLMQQVFMNTSSSHVAKPDILLEHSLPDPASQNFLGH